MKLRRSAVGAALAAAMLALASPAGAQLATLRIASPFIAEHTSQWIAVR
jgi:hypothetical protein